MSIAALTDSFVETYFVFRPDHATARGYKGHDDRAPSFDAATRSAYRAAVAEIRSALSDITPPPDSDTAGIDLEVLRTELAMATFFSDELAWFEINPLVYAEAAVESIESLFFRRDLRASQRNHSLARRLHGIPRLMAQLIAQVHAPAAPFRDAAVDMLASAIPQLEKRISAIRSDLSLREALCEACVALEGAHAHLERRASDVRPFEAMGEERYLHLLRNEHLLTRPLADYLHLAERTVEQVRDALPAAERAEREPSVELADLSWAEVIEYYRNEVEAVRRFLVESELVTIPQGALEVRETPEYLQAMIPGASYLPPPAFGGGRTGYLFIPPIAREMDPAARAYYADLVRRRRARNLIVHEVYPGHHVQFLHAARHPSAIRKVRDNDVMSEGWALYCEQLMQEQGLFNEIPSSRPLRALRMRALRVIVDVGIHTGTMSLDDAVEFLCSHLGTRARPFVEAEVRRYATEPTQAMSYLVGRELVLELREEWLHQCTPEAKSLRDFHDRFLAEGSIPVALIRRAMLARRLPR